MNKTIKLLGVVAGTLILSSCSFLSPVNVGPDSGFVINTAPDHVIQSHRGSGVLLVMTPDTNPLFDTTRIAFTARPYQISYYANSHWAESPANMLSPLLMQTLQKSHHFKTVIAPPFAGQYTYALRTEIKTLLIDYTRRMPVLQMTLQEQLISPVSGRLISARDFTTSVPLHHKSPYGAVVAANQAASRLLAEIAVWCVHNTHR